VKRDVEIIARINVINCATNYDLVFRSIPIRFQDWTGTGEFERIYFDAIYGRTESDQRSVFIGVGECEQRRARFLRVRPIKRAQNAHLKFNKI
jgi:hypothetical protein